MTKEEAIQILSTRDAHGVLCGYTSGVTEALDMAIEALKEHESATLLMNDLISRQGALKPFCTAPDGTRIPEVDCDNFPVEFSVEFIKKHLLSLPSVEADWIPCSERLPSDSGNYLITVADLRLGHIGEHTVTIADFYAKAKKWNSIVDVVAWMPLPTPYKGGEKE